MKCYFGADDRAAEEEGWVLELRDPTTWDEPLVYALAPELDAICDRCGERPATWSATWSATDTRTTPWGERRLCEVCTAEELAPHALGEAEGLEHGFAELSEKGRRTRAGDLTNAIESLARWWKVLPAPPEAVAALERCRRL
jgi:hypothetical protein